MVVWDFQAMEAAVLVAAGNPSTWGQALNVVTAQTESFGAILVPATGRIPPNVPFSHEMEETIRAS